MDTYRILHGTFKQPDGTLLGAGETIDLATDVAATHTAQLQRVEPPAQAEPAAQAEQPAA